ncbi:MAG: alkaline phosphatase family protein [Acidimicrobiales bacterium]|nr:alkaline phosphatase family protein [Acidimicrobiales bacterium]
MNDVEQMVIPTHGEKSVSSIVPAIITQQANALVSENVLDADCIVLLIVDGLGYEQLEKHRSELPFLGPASATAITTVAPSTTASALTSISTGVPPGEHGVVGYKIPTSQGLLNCLRWSVGSKLMMNDLPPIDFQPVEPFLGTHPSVITRAEFQSTGFTQAHLRNGNFCGWWSPATLVTEITHQVRLGVSFVYAYYDGLDKVGHVHGLEDHYLDELKFVDALVERIVQELPDGAVLLVTADHGMVAVGDNVLNLDEELIRGTSSTSGEARFLWLHAKERSTQALMDMAQIYADVAWIVSIDQMLDEQWFGPYVSSEARRRLGDVAVVAREAIAVIDPRLPDSPHLIARHGSVTAAEMLVPFLRF